MATVTGAEACSWSFDFRCAYYTTNRFRRARWYSEISQDVHRAVENAAEFLRGERAFDVLRRILVPGVLPLAAAPGIELVEVSGDLLGFLLQVICDLHVVYRSPSGLG